MRTVHELNKHHECPHCGIGFSDKKCLRKHIRRLHEQVEVQNQRPTFSCNDCKTTFSTKQGLENHLKGPGGPDCEIEKEMAMEELEDDDWGDFNLKDLDF